MSLDIARQELGGADLEDLTFLRGGAAVARRFLPPSGAEARPCGSGPVLAAGEVTAPTRRSCHALAAPQGVGAGCGAA